MCKCAHMCQSTFLQIRRHRLLLALNHRAPTLSNLSVWLLMKTSKDDESTKYSQSSCDVAGSSARFLAKTVLLYHCMRCMLEYKKTATTQNIFFTILWVSAADEDERRQRKARSIFLCRSEDASSSIKFIRLNCWWRQADAKKST